MLQLNQKKDCERSRGGTKNKRTESKSILVFRTYTFMTVCNYIVVYVS